MRDPDPARLRENSRRWREANPERARTLERARKRRWRAANPDKPREIRHRDQNRLRASVLDHYGHACACCGSTDRLTVDHVNGDGNEHRKQIGVGWAIYRWLIANDFPPGFQILCRPCNASKSSGTRCRLIHPGGIS